MSSEPQTVIIGSHQLLVEEDVLVLIQHGDYTLDDSIKVLAEAEGVLLGRVYVLVDQTHAGSTLPEARRYLRPPRQPTAAT